MIGIPKMFQFKKISMIKVLAFLKTFLCIYLLVCVAALICGQGLMLLMTPFSLFDGNLGFSGWAKMALQLVPGALIVAITFARNKTKRGPNATSKK